MTRNVNYNIFNIHLIPKLPSIGACSYDNVGQDASSRVGRAHVESGQRARDGKSSRLAKMVRQGVQAGVSENT